MYNVKVQLSKQSYYIQTAQYLTSQPTKFQQIRYLMNRTENLVWRDGLHGGTRCWTLLPSEDNLQHFGLKSWGTAATILEHLTWAMWRWFAKKFLPVLDITICCWRVKHCLCIQPKQEANLLQVSFSPELSTAKFVKAL